MKTTKMLFYCTIGKPYLYNDVDNSNDIYKVHCLGIWGNTPNIDKFKLSNKPVLDSLNGKVVAECEVETEEIRSYISRNEGIVVYATPTLYCSELLEKSCLSLLDLYNYIGDKGYALHIKNLKIFDNPKYIFEYDKCEKGTDVSAFIPIQKAPQNMMKVYDKEGNSYILISIRSPWVCKFFNGEKEIEVRSKVMKEMLSNE